MSFEPAPEAPAPAAKKKKLSGCLLALIILVLLLFGSCGAGTLWLAWPPSPPPLVGVGGPDSVTVVRLKPAEGDQGVQALLARVVAHSQAREDEGLPDALRWMKRLNDRNAAQQLRYWVPEDAVIAVRADRRMLAGVGPRVGGGFVKMMFRMASLVVEKEGGRRFEHKGARGVVTPDGDAAAALLGATVLVGSDEATVREALDRLDPDAPPPPLPPELLAPIQRAGVSGSDLVAVTLEAGLVRQLVFGREEPPDASSGVVALDLVDDERGRAVVELVYGSPAEAEQARARWSALSKDVLARWKERGLTVRPTATIDGGTLRFEAELEGVATTLLRWLERDPEAEPVEDGPADDGLPPHDGPAEDEGAIDDGR
jgi:hypothetical protein